MSTGGNWLVPVWNYWITTDTPINRFSTSYALTSVDYANSSRPLALFGTLDTQIRYIWAVQWSTWMPLALIWFISMLDIGRWTKRTFYLRVIETTFTWISGIISVILIWVYPLHGGRGNVMTIQLWTAQSILLLLTGIGLVFVSYFTTRHLLILSCMRLNWVWTAVLFIAITGGTDVSNWLNQTSTVALLLSVFCSESAQIYVIGNQRAWQATRESLTYFFRTLFAGLRIAYSTSIDPTLAITNLPVLSQPQAPILVFTWFYILFLGITEIGILIHALMTGTRSRTMGKSSRKQRHKRSSDIEIEPRKHHQYETVSTEETTGTEEEDSDESD